VPGFSYQLRLDPVVYHCCWSVPADPDFPESVAFSGGGRSMTVSKYRLRRQGGMFLTYLGIVAALAFFLMPFLWIVTTALKGNEDYFSYPPVWVPTPPSLVHYKGLFERGNGLLYFK